MTETFCLNISSLDDTKKLAIKISNYYKQLNVTDNSSFKIYLVGDLGAGKTTFARYFLHSFDQSYKVKSPTYTLIENYNFDNYKIYHLDLYRLADPEELCYLAIEDFIDNADTLVLIEWPSKGKGYIPEPSLIIELNNNDDLRTATLKFNKLDKNLWQE